MGEHSKKEKKEKKHKKKDKKKDKKKEKKEKSKDPVQLSKYFNGSAGQSDSDSSQEVLRSSISGKRIKRKRERGAVDQAEEARRRALLSRLNGGEGGAAELKQASEARSQQSVLEERWKQCLADPSKMAEMMADAAANRKAKKKRLGAMVRGSGSGTCSVGAGGPGGRERGLCRGAGYRDAQGGRPEAEP